MEATYYRQDPRSKALKLYSDAYYIQSGLFDPGTKVNDLYDRIQQFLEFYPNITKYIILRMLKDCMEVQIYKAWDIVQFIFRLQEEGLIPTNLEGYPYPNLPHQSILNEEAYIRANIEYSLAGEGYLDAAIHTIIYNDRFRLRQILFISRYDSELTINRVFSYRKVALIDFAILMGSYECVQTMLEMDIKFTNESPKYASFTLTDSQISELKINPKLSNIDALTVRKFGMIKVLKQDDYKYINSHDIILPLIKPIDSTLYFPEYALPFYRIGVMNDNKINDNYYLKFSQLADNLYDEDTNDFDVREISGLPPDKVLKLIAAASERRPKKFSSILNKTVQLIKKGEFKIKTDTIGHDIEGFDSFISGLLRYNIGKYTFNPDPMKLNYYIQFISDDKFVEFRFHDLELKSFLYNQFITVKELLENKEELTRILGHPGSSGPLRLILLHDDLDELIKCIITNKKRIGCVFIYKNTKITFLNRAAQLGARRCFFYMLNNGYDLSTRSSLNATQGGDIEILKKAMEFSFNPDQLIVEAIVYRRIKFINYFLREFPEIIWRLCDSVLCTDVYLPKIIIRKLVVVGKYRYMSFDRGNKELMASFGYIIDEYILEKLSNSKAFASLNEVGMRMLS